LLMARAVYLSMSGHTDAARIALNECLKLARTVKEPRHVYVSLRCLIDIESEIGHSEEAVTLCRELVAMNRADRFTSGLAIALCMLSQELANLGEIDEALATAREAAPLHAQRGTPLWIWLVSFAQIAYKEGRLSDAARAFGRAQAKYGSVPNSQRDRDRLRSLLERSLSNTELQRLLAEGAALTDEEAARIALAS
jgi:tetratricopeptide (TPR) repeat protein